jgi:hypothetical protein
MTESVHEKSLPKSASVRKEYEVLKALVTAPNLVDEGLRAAIMLALATQGSLAAFEHAESGIIAMSLNTHKALANSVVEGGYEALNDYRKAALIKLRDFEERESAPGRGTIDWYKNELSTKNTQLTQVADDIAIMSQRLDEVLRLAQEMAKAAGQQEAFKKRRGELLRKFKRPDSEPS